MNKYFIGIDIGTSSVKCAVIDETANDCGLESVALPLPIVNGRQIEQDSSIWWDAVMTCLKKLLKKIDGQSVLGISIDGTSGTLVPVDQNGNAVMAGIMYNDGRAENTAIKIKRVAPAETAAHGATSPLGKIMRILETPESAGIYKFIHQADFIQSKFTGNFTVSDFNNALKTGFDPEKQIWPDWIKKLGVPVHILPDVFEPGFNAGKVLPRVSEELNLNHNCNIYLGTTDSIASFMASGAGEIGDAVSVHGTTLSVKMVVKSSIFRPEYGIYSHWMEYGRLIGGASNVGGKILRHYFTDKELAALSEKINPVRDTGLDYYPLIQPGERFPVNDPHFLPRMEPIPPDRVIFLQGILEGIARVEKRCYDLLTEFSGIAPKRIFSSGGSAMNKVFTEIRHRILGIAPEASRFNEAAYGSAILALKSYQKK